MSKPIKVLSSASRLIVPSNGFGTLPAVDSIVGAVDAVDLDEFRRRAFVPEVSFILPPFILRLYRSRALETCLEIYGSEAHTNLLKRGLYS
jgi:hypothetical protein